MFLSQISETISRHLHKKLRLKIGSVITDGIIWISKVFAATFVIFSDELVEHSQKRYKWVL